MPSPKPLKSALKKPKSSSRSSPRSKSPVVVEVPPRHVTLNYITESSSGKHGRLEKPRKQTFTSDPKQWSWHDQKRDNVEDTIKSSIELKDEELEAEEYMLAAKRMERLAIKEALKAQREAHYVRPQTYSSHNGPFGGRKTKKNKNSRKRVSKKNRR